MTTAVRVPNLQAVMRLHERVIGATGGLQGVRDSNCLAAAVERPHAGCGDVEFYVTLFEKTAALAHSIARGHPFVDGNKRTALLAAAYTLALNGFVLDASQAEQEDTMVVLAAGGLDVADFAAWLESHTSSALPSR
jgi:death-on-curing protein